MFRRTTIHALLAILMVALIGMGQALSAGATDPGLALQEQLKQLLAQKAEHPSDPAILIRMADLYLDLGDDPDLEQVKRKAAYDEGAKAAKEAIALQEQNADAHYLYAANLGSAAQLTGLMASAWTVKELKQHVDRALAIKPDHASALHMKGMMLEELPWMLGGDADGALAHLQHAVTANPDHVHTRLDLAKVYLKRKNQAAARKELDAILARPLSPTASASERRHRDETQRLLNTIKKP